MHCTIMRELAFVTPSAFPLFEQKTGFVTRIGRQFSSQFLIPLGITH